MPVSPCAGEQFIQIGLAPFTAGDLGDDLLGQYVQWLVGRYDCVQFTSIDGIEQGGTFNQVIQGEWKKPPLGSRLYIVTGATHALQKSGD